MRRTIALVLVAAAAIASSTSRADDPPPQLPPGVIARVYDREVREQDLVERLVRRFRNVERGKAIFDQLVDDTCVAIEAGKRNVTVTDDEVRAYVASVDRKIRDSTGGSRTIQDVYREEHSDERDFAAHVHEYLLRQKMAREDLGGKPGEEVAEAMLKLWLSTLRRRVGVKLTDLPPGVLARVGDVAIDRARYGTALLRGLQDEEVKSERADLVLEAAAQHALDAAKVVVTDEEAAGEIAKRRERFLADPRVKGTGLTFDQFLRQTIGLSEDEFAKDPSFRTQLGLKRLLARGVTDADVKRRWEENRDAYGERAMVRQLLVQAQDAGSKVQLAKDLPSFQEAYEMALQAKVRVLEGTGEIGTGPKRPLRDAITAVAKQLERDEKKKAAAGEPVVWKRVDLAGDDKLADAAFTGDIGTLLGPIRSRVGYHLVVVEERRPAPTFEEIRERVREDLLSTAVANFQIALRADPHVVIAETK